MKPIWFAFEVTEACNLNCNFCYNVWHDNRNPRPNKLLSLDQIEKLLGNIHGMGITLTGGEPLLRNDITEIAQLCSNAGFQVALATNGSLLNKAEIDKCVKAGVRHFDIGFTNPSHETRIAVTSAVASGCTVTASVCIHGMNYRRTGMLTSIAAALGADAVALNRFVPTGRGARNEKRLRLGNKELIAALDMADNVATGTGITVYTGIPVEPCIASATEFPAIEFSTCRCGDTKWVIDSRGNLRTCEQNRETLGNLLDSSFSDILNREAVKLSKFRNWRPSENCRSCRWRRNCCGGCRFN